DRHRVSPGGESTIRRRACGVSSNLLSSPPMARSIPPLDIRHLIFTCENGPRSPRRPRWGTPHDGGVYGRKRPYTNRQLRRCGIGPEHVSFHPSWPCEDRGGRATGLAYLLGPL